MIGIDINRMKGTESAIFCRETVYVSIGLADLLFWMKNFINNLFPNFKEEINVSF
jgi:hypothetical protein